MCSVKQVELIAIDMSQMCSTCLEVVMNSVLVNSRHFAGTEQHSELVHI